MILDSIKNVSPYVLLGSGWVFGRLQPLYDAARTFVMRYTRINISATEPDLSYEELDSFVASLPQKRIKNFYFRSPDKLIPGLGYNYFIWKKHILVVQRTESTTGTGAERPPKTLSISVILGNQTHIEEISKQGYLLVKAKKQENFVHTFGVKYDNYWSSSAARPRPLSTVSLPAVLREKIMDTIKDFTLSETRYEEMGIPYKLGILLHGPPGTGKTSLVSSLSYELKMPLYLLNLGDGMGDKGLQSAITQIPPQSIVVMEDIDTVTPGRQKHTRGVSLSCLLNVMDGMLCPHGVIFCLTTNYPEKLDSALIRHGRIDLNVELTYATDEQIEDMYLRFFPNSPKAKDFVSRYSGKKTTTAKIQEDLVAEKITNARLF